MPEFEDGVGEGPGREAFEPVLQVICLGSGGGPSEDDVSGFLIRATASDWSKNSVLAVDAGSHLAAITRILAKDFPMISDAELQPQQLHKASNGGKLSQDGAGFVQPSTPSSSFRKSSQDERKIVLSSGPFAGVTVNGRSARANALQIVRDYVSTYLITHPHLDHLSGFAINTAAMHKTSRPKRLAAMPSTVSAIKEHIFNDVIWPNLTDEDGGVGFVTFQRLAEGGNIALGEGFSRGYIEVCDGLSVKGFKVSHGHCMKGPGHVHSGSGAGLYHADSNQATTQRTPYNNIAADGRRFSIPNQSLPGTPVVESRPCVIDSTAYFIRDDETGKEVLVFGDVEPDSLSLSPRTGTVWGEAAPKIAVGLLSGIFIECSYDDSQSDQTLFGHMAPRHLIRELQTLAAMVGEERAQETRGGENGESEGERRQKANTLKRKRTQGGTGLLIEEEDEHRPVKRKESISPRGGAVNGLNGGFADRVDGDHTDGPCEADEDALDDGTSMGDQVNGVKGGYDELRGVRVFIMHMKDTLRDGPHIGETILKQLKEHEADLRSQGESLGCEFVICKRGGSYWF